VTQATPSPHHTALGGVDTGAPCSQQPLDGCSVHVWQSVTLSHAPQQSSSFVMSGRWAFGRLALSGKENP
jgi:hypothetical protein